MEYYGSVTVDFFGIKQTLLITKSYDEVSKIAFIMAENGCLISYKYRFLPKTNKPQKDYELN